MSPDEQIKLLAKSVEAWNDHRKQNPEFIPKLANCDLSGANLQGANLEKANLSGAKLLKADLIGANLRYATLAKSDLSEVTAPRADFTEANLSYACLRAADLSGAKFAKADLAHVILRDANLARADLRNAIGLSAAGLGATELGGAKLPESIAEFTTLKYAQDVSKHSQTLFLAILAACAFAWLAIGTSRDEHLLLNSSEFRLPIIDTELPIVGFYVVAPMLIFSVFLWFLLYLQRLCDALASLPAIFPDGVSLDRKVHPWLFNGIVRLRFERLRANRPPFAGVQAFLTTGLVFWIAPFTLTLLWARFVCRHDVVITPFQVLWIAQSVAVSTVAQLSCRDTLRGVPEPQRKQLRPVAFTSFFLATALCGVFSLMAHYPNALYTPDWARRWLAVDIANAQISRYPKPWSANPDRLMKRTPLMGLNLQAMNATHGKLQWVDLSDADLSGALLMHADLSGALLVGATLIGADLTDATLIGADLRDCDLSKAILKDADATNATFSALSNLEGADLEGVELMGAVGLTAKQVRLASSLRDAHFPAHLGNELRSKPIQLRSQLPQPGKGSPELAIHFIDVGQGDCTLIKCPNGEAILVDCGSLGGGDAALVRKYIRKQLGESSEIHTLVITHPDASHYNLVEDVLKGSKGEEDGDVPVKKILLAGSTDEYSAHGFSEWLDKHSSIITRLGKDDFDAPDETPEFLDCGEALVHVLAADVAAVRSPTNARSIVLLVSFRDIDVMLTGDATFDTEERILQRYVGGFLGSEVLKVAHHGSKTMSTSIGFVDQIRPEVSIISAGKDNRFGHPRIAVVERLETYALDGEPHSMQWCWREGRGLKCETIDEYSRAIYSTAVNGTITVRSDGTEYSVEYSNR